MGTVWVELPHNNHVSYYCERAKIDLYVWQDFFRGEFNFLRDYNFLWRWINFHKFCITLWENSVTNFIDMKIPCIKIVFILEGWPWNVFNLHFLFNGFWWRKHFYDLNISIIFGMILEIYSNLKLNSELKIFCNINILCVVFRNFLLSLPDSWIFVPYFKYKSHVPFDVEDRKENDREW